MIKLVRAAVLAAGVPLALLGAASSGTIEQQIIAANADVQQATMQFDVATAKKLITDDYVLVVSNGKLMDRTAFLADVADRGTKWEKNDTEQIAVRQYNGDCAILTAVLRQRYTYGGKLYDYRVRITDTWVKVDGNWRYASGQASMLQKLAWPT